MRHYNENDRLLELMLPKVQLASLDMETLKNYPDAEVHEIFHPEENNVFRHELAIIEFKGVLFAAWYSCPAKELAGETPIVFCRSFDGGKTWTRPETVATDPTGAILYCPPVFGIEDGKLYMLLNQMVAPDHMHSLDLYIFDEEAEKFTELWSRPIPFKLNTNIYTLPDGRLMLPGRIGDLDKFPNTPALMTAEKIDSEWKLEYIAPDGNLPDGTKYVYPELSAILDGDDVWMFCRDDERQVPLVYKGKAGGEWTLYAHDIPFINSKIYSGTLSDGRNYLIGNIWHEKNEYRRAMLAIFFSEKGTMNFTEGYLLQDGYSEELGYGGIQWSYPCAWEEDGKLYVIYTGCVEDNDHRAAVLSILPLK